MISPTVKFTVLTAQAAGASLFVLPFCAGLLVLSAVYQLGLFFYCRQREQLIMLPAALLGLLFIASLYLSGPLQLLTAVMFWGGINKAVSFLLARHQTSTRLSILIRRGNYALAGVWALSLLVAPSVMAAVIGLLCLTQLIVLGLMVKNSQLDRPWRELFFAALAALLLTLLLVPFIGLSVLLCSLTFLTLLAAFYLSSMLLLGKQQQLLQSEQQLTTYRYELEHQGEELEKQKELAEDMERQFQSRNFELEVTLRELEEINRKLEQQTTTDALTGAKNRKFFDKKLLAELRRSRREQTWLSLVMLDIDHFKQVNDNHGHLTGDDCIRLVAQRAQESLKRPSDLLARYGGEEFALVLPNTPPKGAIVVAEAILEAIRCEMFPTVSGPLAITASAGVTAKLCELDTTPNDLIQLADQALYKAKEAGRDNVQCCMPEERTVPKA